MNQLLHLILNDLKLLSKTKIFYLKLILFPCLLIIILGNMFGNNSSKLTPFTIAYYSEDQGINDNSKEISPVCLGDTLLNNVFKSSDLSSYLTITPVSSNDEGKAMVDNKQASAFIHVPKDFSESYIKNTASSIDLVTDPAKSIDKSIINTILNRFYRNIQTIRLENQTVLDSIGGSSFVNTDDITTVLKQISGNNSAFDSISKKSLHGSLLPLNTMQYVSIAMTVMFSILTAFELAHSIVDEKLNYTQFRIQSTPVSALTYAFGKICGIILAIIVQMFIVVLISHFAFHVDFGNLFYVLLITVCYGFTIGAIVFSAGMAAKDQMAISSFSSLILYGFSFLGGSFVDKTSFPESLQYVQKLIPNGKAINSYLKICQGGSITDIYADLIALILIGVVFIGVGLHLYSQRRI